MSLLRNVLRKNTANADAQPVAGLSEKSKQSLLSVLRRKSDVGDGASIRSSSGATVHSVRSIAESVTSFASAFLGGKRVPKRRRPDISRLGAPKWYDKNPPEAPEMPGVEETDITRRPFTAAHGYVRENDAGDRYMSVVLYSYAPESATTARYYDNTRITGELRVRLEKPDTITSIDIWCLAKAESNFSVLDGHHVQYQTNLWDRRKRLNGVPGGSLPIGKTLIFPFEFEPLPKDLKINRPDSTVVTKVPLPPSYYFTSIGSFGGQIKYFIGIDIKREGFMTSEEQWDIPIHYYPLRRPLVSERTMFPFIPHREDWPYAREDVGGWTVTPFGGRGRFKDEMVEIEGLLGVQAPTVYTAGQTLHYSLLLWSKSIPALEALTNPAEADIDAVFASCDVFGTDALHPRNSVRRNRVTKRLAQGRVWRTDDGPPEGDEMAPLREGPKGGLGKEAETKVVPTPPSPTKNASSQRSRMQEVLSAVDADDESEADEIQIAAEGLRSPSPASDEDVDSLSHPEGTVRLDGDIRIPSGLVPSFRYKWMGREYTLHVTFTHPDYVHISPSAVSIYAETPLWIVLGRPADSEAGEKNSSGNTGPQLSLDGNYLNKLLVVGDAIVVDENAVRAEVARAGPTSKVRTAKDGPRYGT